MSELNSDFYGRATPAQWSSERIVRHAHYLACAISQLIHTADKSAGFEANLRVLVPRTPGASQERALKTVGEVSPENRMALDLLYATRAPNIDRGLLYSEERVGLEETVTRAELRPVGEGCYVEERVGYKLVGHELSAVCFELFLVRPLGGLV